MSLWIDIKYANQLRNALPLFKVKKTSPYLANFRCVLCGDSQSSKTKCRGYIYEKNAALKFKCMRCGEAWPLRTFLKRVDSSLFNEYTLESLKDFRETQAFGSSEKFEPKLDAIPKKRYSQFEPLKSLKKISQLKDTHPAKVYITGRLIPPQYHHKLYFCDKFKTWVNTFLADKFDEKQTLKDEARIIIPFIDRNGFVFGLQGRSLDPKASLRYITIMIEDRTKVFGLEGVDTTEPYCVFEGPIDSMFIPNSIAAAGSDLTTVVTNQDKATMVFDNEPRSEIIVKKMHDCVDMGLKICIWPKAIRQKDVNQMVLAGVKDVARIISEHTYSGMRAKLALGEWSKA